MAQNVPNVEHAKLNLQDNRNLSPVLRSKPPFQARISRLHRDHKAEFASPTVDDGTECAKCRTCKAKPTG